MYKKVSTDLNFVEREKQIEQFWKEHEIFKKITDTAANKKALPGIRAGRGGEGGARRGA